MKDKLPSYEHVKMPLSDRQSQILRDLRAAGQVQVDRLAADFDVATQTIRRDLSALCDAGLAARIHGGARMISGVASAGYAARRETAEAEKQLIASHVAQLIPNDCSVMLNIGTTTEQVAMALSDHSGLMVITNNLNIANLLVVNRDIELVLAGGVVRQSDGAIVGDQAASFMDQFKADYAVIGASAVDQDGSALDFDAREVAVAQAILRNAKQRILAVDASKLDCRAPRRICGLDQLDYVVTTAKPPTEFMAAAEDAGCKVMVADAKH
ncbi:MAG: DeoR/GlpR family DNA-binding transcription regulator [Pikeienuella sp.]